MKNLLLGGLSNNICLTLLSFKNDTNDLVDFEHKKFEKQLIVLRKEEQVGIKYLVKQGDLYKTVHGEELDTFTRDNADVRVILKLFWEDQKCVVSSPDGSHYQVPKCFSVVSDHLWRRVYGRLNGSHAVAKALKEGDRIQLGRVGLIVRYLAQRKLQTVSHLQNLITEETLVVNNSEIEEPSVSYRSNTVAAASRMSCSEFEGPILEDEEQQISEQTPNVCRICLCDDDTSGPLVVPCKCKGSMRYVHLECIRTWIKGRLKMYDGDGCPNISFFLQKLECELCGEPYPSYVNVDNKETDFLGLDQPDPPYAVLQLENANELGYFLISLARKPSLIGRGHDCDVRLADISVSRLHSVLYYSDGHFILEDKRSKFGTLVENSESFSFTLENGLPIAIRMGSDLICISSKPQVNLAVPCCGDLPSRSLRFIV